MAISESLKIAMAATARSNARCQVIEHEARQSIRMAESVRPSVTQVEHLTPSIIQCRLKKHSGAALSSQISELVHYWMLPQVYLNNAPTNTTIRTTLRPTGLQTEGPGVFGSTMGIRRGGSEAPVITISTRHLT